LRRLRRPPIPREGKPVDTRPLESEIQKQILDYLAAERIFAIRFNTGALRDRTGRVMQFHSAGPGVADILAFFDLGGTYWAGDREIEDVHHQQVLWIEVKRPGEQQRESQKQFQAYVEEQGHYYLVARDVADVVDWQRQFDPHWSEKR